MDAHTTSESERLASGVDAEFVQAVHSKDGPAREPREAASYYALSRFISGIGSATEVARPPEELHGGDANCCRPARNVSLPRHSDAGVEQVT